MKIIIIAIISILAIAAYMEWASDRYESAHYIANQ